MSNEAIQYIINCGVPTVAIIVVGLILRQQIKSQKSVINSLVLLAQATSPEKIIAFQDRELKQIESIMSRDIDLLQKQNYEFINYISQLLLLESDAMFKHDPDFIDYAITKHFTHSRDLLERAITWLKENKPSSE